MTPVQLFVQNPDTEWEAGIITLIPEYLLNLSILSVNEQEAFGSIWWECKRRGMEEVLFLVALQTLIGKRIPRDASQMTELLHFINDANIKIASLWESRVYTRIFCWCVGLVVARHKIEVHHRANTTPYVDNKIIGEINEAQKVIVKFVLENLDRCKNADSRKMLLTHLHQMFLENSTLIELVYEVTNESKLIPWIVEYIPSTRMHLIVVCLDIYCL